MNIRTFVAILSRNPQYDFPKMRGRGSKAVWNFSEVSSVLEMPSVPKGGEGYRFIVRLHKLERERDSPSIHSSHPPISSSSTWYLWLKREYVVWWLEVFYESSLSSSEARYQGDRFIVRLHKERGRERLRAFILSSPNSSSFSPFTFYRWVVVHRRCFDLIRGQASGTFGEQLCRKLKV